MNARLLGIWLFTYFLLATQLPSASASSNPEIGSVIVAKLDGVINVAALDLVKECVDEAHKMSAPAIVLLLDTPGGMLDTTFEIIKLIEQTSIPVISFVYPKGSKAWSAGTFIALSSHLVAMAPHSLLGSCQPRAYPSGELIDDPKLVNSLTEFLVQRARMHGRNETVAAKFVKENLNVAAEDALNFGVVEAMAPTMEELLAMVDGMEVEVAKRGRVIVQTRGVDMHYFGPSIRVRVLRILADPTIAYLLFTLGVWGVVFGFFTAGFEGEIIGGILLILGLIGLGFYLNLFIVILLVLGGILVFVEMRDPGLQFFGPAGAFCLLLGSLLFLQLDPERWSISPEWYWSFMIAVAVIAAILAGFSLFVFYKLLRSAKQRPTTLKFLGEFARAIDQIEPDKEGFIRFRGEYWKARSSTSVNPGQKVKIIAKDGPVLVVEPAKEE